MYSLEKLGQWSMLQLNVFLKPNQSTRYFWYFDQYKWWLQNNWCSLQKIYRLHLDKKLFWKKLYCYFNRDINNHQFIVNHQCKILNIVNCRNVCTAPSFSFGQITWKWLLIVNHWPQSDTGTGMPSQLLIGDRRQLIDNEEGGSWPSASVMLVPSLSPPPPATN